MKKAALKNPEFFEILDEITGNKYSGCNQEWYRKPWQRMAGCGPTVASNIILYNRKNSGTIKCDALRLMEELWKHVTPTFRGVNSTNIFHRGLKSLAESKNAALLYDAVDIPEKKEMRSSLEAVVSFIGSSLEKDIPVAYLNLCNGDEKNLDKWHWVTLIAIEYEDDMSSVFAEILDEGMKKTVDLLLWYNTTTLGGGFVAFSLI